MVAPGALNAKSKKKAPEPAAQAQPKAADPNALDWQMVTRIREEEFHRSKVMDTLYHLSDEIGPRLTLSPNYQKALTWTQLQLTRWGMSNVHLEKWGPFGRGWDYETSTVRMITPDKAELIVLPEAWTAGTNGPVRGQAVLAVLESKADLDKYRGKLKNQIVLIGAPRELKPLDKAQSHLYSDEELLKESMFDIHQPNMMERMQHFKKLIEFRKELDEFLQAEQPAVVIEPSRAPGQNGTLFVQSATFEGYKQGQPAGVPQLVMDVEQYNRLARLIQHKQAVELEANVKTNFYFEDPYAYNVIAEIPGTDLKDQVVMIGGHLDSWHGGTGATDNGAGTAVMMEVMRLIKTLGIKPRRTIRIALWTGEEEGLLGSQGYVSEHLGTYPRSTSPAVAWLPEFLRPQGGPVEVKPEHSKVSIYYNLDSGTGKIRGIYTQENDALDPIFEQYMKPFHDLGMTTLTNNDTGGSDFLSFDAVGVPGVDFIQDDVDYETLTHHSNMDVYDHVVPENLEQAAAIITSFVYQSAMRDEMMPRMPMPQPVEIPTDESHPTGQ